jgi:hypothetical protein
VEQVFSFFEREVSLGLLPLIGIWRNTLWLLRLTVLWVGFFPNNKRPWMQGRLLFSNQLMISCFPDS